MKSGQKKPRRRLFWRLYLSGVLLIATVAILSGVVIHYTMGEPNANDVAGRVFHHLFRPPSGSDLHEPGRRDPPDFKRGRRGGPEKMGRLGARLHDPDFQQGRLEEMQEVLEGEAAIYERDGTLLASYGENPPAPMSLEEARELRHWKLDKGDVFIVNVPVARGPNAPYLRWRVPPGSHRRPLPPLIMIGIGLLLSAVIFLPVARGIARPIEKMSSTARALGEGELGVRTGIVRKDEIGFLAISLDEAADDIARLLRSEKEMLANVSHELRTPLARLRVALELCEEEEGIAVVRERLVGMATDIAELDGLVGDILMAARLELVHEPGAVSGFVLRKEIVSLPTFLEETKDRFALRSPDASLKLETAVDGVELIVDRSLVHRVVGNMLDNAAKYARPGDGAQIELVAEQSEGFVAFEVRDRGIGVPEEDLPRLFEAFFRSERSHSKKISGTGLGLTLCKRIIEAHGGQIEVSNRDGGGLRVRFTLPMEVEAEVS